MSERERIEQSIAGLEAQRAILGDAVVDPAIAALREKLATWEPPPPTQQQRKQITVLFADVSGFTAMSETMDAEDVTEVMNALWGRLDMAIIEHGGLIDKHIGDAVMALWGADVAREDDPERAIEGALAMQGALAAFREERGVSLATRIGLNTGPVLLSEVGTTHEYTAMGDTVNLASRLEQAAPVDGILISHDTYRHVRGVFDVLPQVPLTVKGKAEPIQTYIVQRAKPRAFRMSTRGIEGVETRMVGREAELLVLQNAFADVIGAGETRLTMVVGEAGVGKSRLLYEFENWLELRLEQIYYFKGRAIPALQRTPYSLLRDMFAYRFDILESDNAATALEKFRVGMADRLAPDQADLVGHLIGFDFSTSPVVRNLLGSPAFGPLAMAYLTNYIRALANQLTVIFLEDVHWADVSSLDLVNRLVREIPAARLLVVCLARPTFFERFPDWGAGAQGSAGKLDRPEFYIRLDLQPLAATESRLLVGEILQRADAVPDALRDLVVSGAEGNPFYVEETIKMLMEDGVIERDEHQWRVKVERLAAVQVPPTLTGILQARLDSLLHEERSILQRASVVGRSFWDAAVIELAADELDGAKVNMLLRALYSRELIFGQKRSAFAGTTEYIFKHAMLRDVTYETVLLKLRRIYHAQVARWLEANAGERLGEYLALIARHYELAGENAKASEYLQRSGQELYKVSAFQDAISAFDGAMTLLPPDNTADRAGLLVELGNVHMQLGDYDIASQHLEQGLALACAIEDQSTEVIALNGLGRIAIERGIHVEAERYLGQGLALARKNNDQPGAALALRHLGMSAYYQGQYAEAERHMREGLAVYRELKDRQGIANILNGLGLVLLRQGMYAEAKRHFEKSLEIFRLIGDRQGAARCLNNLGDLAQEHREAWKALQFYEEALAIGREIDYRFGVVVFLFNLGYIYAEQGEEPRARRYLGESLKESYALGMVDFGLSVLIGLALLHAQAGRYQLAANVMGALGYPDLPGEPLQAAESVLAILRQNLTAEQLTVALEHQSFDLKTLEHELLAEVQ